MQLRSALPGRIRGGLLVALVCGAVLESRPAAAQDAAAEAKRYEVGHSVYTAGSYVSLGGGAIALGGFFTGALYDVKIGNYVTYAGGGIQALGFALSAGGLGTEHSAAANLGRDPGRGLFIAGTVLGTVGVLASGASYAIGGLQPFSDADTNFKVGLAVMGGSFVFLTVSNILYNVDQRRLARAMAGVYAF